jgi:signal transduction histidine kinase
MPPAVEAAVYFVCAEALTNAVKHAHADATALTICAREDVVTTVISDNGVGGADPGGAGLQGLADRTEALGGTLTIQTGREQGTVVTARIPLNDGS